MPDQPIILFDGTCKLCDGTVQFIKRHDQQQQFRFVPLQSAEAQRLLASVGADTPNLDSIVLIEDQQVFMRSDAALRIAARLPAPWRWLTACRWIPRPLRDWAYTVVARNRHRWFGQKTACDVRSDESHPRPPD